SSQTSVVSADSSEKFDSRWPADNHEPPKTALMSSDPSTRRPAILIARAAPAAAPAVASPAMMAPSIPASEAKKVHTIIIRSDGSEQTDASAVAVAHSTTRARVFGIR